MNTYENYNFNEREELTSSVQLYERHLRRLPYGMPNDIEEQFTYPIEGVGYEYGVRPYSREWYEIQTQSQLLKHPTPDYTKILRNYGIDDSNFQYAPQTVNAHIILNDLMLARGRLAFLDAQDFHKQAESLGVTWYQLAYTNKTSETDYPFKEDTITSLRSLPQLRHATYGYVDMSSPASAESCLLLFKNNEESLPETLLLDVMDSPAQRMIFYPPEQRLAHLVFAGILDIANPNDAGQVNFRLRSLKEITETIDIHILKKLDKVTDDEGVTKALSQIRQGVIPETIETAEMLLSSPKTRNYFTSNAYGTQLARLQYLTLLLHEFRQIQDQLL